MRTVSFNRFSSYLKHKRSASTWSYEGIVAWLLVFFVIADCFKLAFIPQAVPKVLHWGLDISLFLWFLVEVYQRRIPNRILHEYRFVWLFILLVLISMINALIFYNQSLDQSFRVISQWFEYLLVFWIAKKRYNVNDLYYAMFIFTLLVWGLWLYVFLSGEMIVYMDVSEGDLEGARGIERIKIPGGSISTLFMFWSMGKYVKYGKKIYIIIFFISCMFVLFSVSRQHIVAFSIISLLFFFQGLALYKKFIMVITVGIFFYAILPRITIYQRLTEITEQQMDQNDGMINDVRTRGAIYYATQFDQSFYTKIFGNCKYHADSPYGNKINYVVYNYGYVLSDIGFVGIYIYFGIAGLILFGYLLYWTWRQKTDDEYKALKYMVYYLYLGNILSHSLEMSTFIIPCALYLLHMNSRKQNLLFIKSKSFRINGIHSKSIVSATPEDV